LKAEKSQDNNFLAFCIAKTLFHYAKNFGRSGVAQMTGLV